MIVRSKAPLRLGLAGGGTDVSPFSDRYGGCVLNATISLYAYCDIMPRDNGKIILQTRDRGERAECKSERELCLDGNLDIIKAIYNRVVRDFDLPALSFELHTFVDAPAGSGLGTSSTLVVAVLGAFVQWLSLPLAEYDIASLDFKRRGRQALVSLSMKENHCVRLPYPKCRRVSCNSALHNFESSLWAPLCSLHKITDFVYGLIK